MKSRAASSRFHKTLVLALTAALLTLTGLPLLASGGTSGGGSGGGGGTSTPAVDTIKVGKCEYAWTGAYCELLIQAVSSNSAAHLYAYLPDGTYLGEVQNGGGGRYGGTVFLSYYIPQSIIILSSAGGGINAPCVPFQP